MTEFVQKRLISFYNENKEDYKNCDILFNMELCPKDVQSINGYIKKSMGKLSKLNIGEEYE